MNLARNRDKVAAAADLAAPRGQLDRSASLWVRVVWSPTAWTLTVLVTLIVIFSALRPDAFLTTFNLRNIGVTGSSYLIMAVGVTYVLSAGGLDLSVGSVLVLAGVVATKAMVAVGGTSWQTDCIGLLVCLAVGFAVGLLNGVLTAQFGIPALVVTLGTSFAALGLAYVVSGGQDLRGVPDSLTNTIGFASFLGIPYVLLIAVLVAVAGAVIYTTTRFGRYTMVLGSSTEAARRAGIPVQRHLIKLYALAGMLSGLAGFLALAQYGTTTISGHNSDFLYVLLAVILGGTSLFGGVGTVAGTGIAVFVPWVLSNGFIIVGVDPYWQNVVLGGVFIVVVYLDALRRRAREGVRH